MGLIAIGDIHGCLTTLDALLHRLSPTDDDHLIFIGDYIDRGPDSKGVIDRLLTLGERYRCTFLRGNHESLMLDYLNHGAFELWQVNGGLATLESYMTEQRHLCIPEAHIRFVNDTQLYYDTPEYLFVHAGLRPELTVAENLEQCDEETFLWERSHLQARKLAWEKTVLCGHTPQAEPIERERLIVIDTGCVYHHHPHLGRLCAVRLPERAFVLTDYEG